MQPLSDGRYETVAEFVGAVHTPCANSRNTAARDDYFVKEQKTWYGAGCKTGEDVERKISSGWQEGMSMFNAFLPEIEDRDTVPHDRRRRLTRGDMGDSVDVGAVYAGRFQTAWTRATRRDIRAPQRLDILANMLCSGGEDPSVLMWRGIAAAALADKLETAGYMVRIVVGFGGTAESGERVSCRITVKDHGKPLDVASTSAVLLPGFFRALGHAWIVAHATQNVDNGSITVQQGNTEESEVLLTHNVRNKATALAWVNAQIERLNSE
jgi:hypothetical protein